MQNILMQDMNTKDQLWDMKMQHVKMTDQIAGREIIGQ